MSNINLELLDLLDSISDSESHGEFSAEEMIEYVQDLSYESKYSGLKTWDMMPNKEGHYGFIGELKLILPDKYSLSLVGFNWIDVVIAHEIDGKFYAQWNNTLYNATGMFYGPYPNPFADRVE